MTTTNHHRSVMRPERDAPCVPGSGPARQRGVVLVIVLLGIFLLAALMVYLLNLGRHTNARIDTQHAADAAALAGAGWLARSFNIVAMNNVTTARYLAAVPVLDSIPTSIDAALHEQQVLRDGLGLSMNSGAGGLSTGNGSLNMVVNDHLNRLYTELGEEVVMLQEMQGVFQSFDLTSVTHYQTAGGHGRLWQAMEAMTELSPVVLDNAPSLAMLHAAQMGRTNLIRSGAGDRLAFMTPAVEPIPYRHRNHPDQARQTRAADFERPVLYGTLPQWVDQKVTNRGPFDVIFSARAGVARTPNANHHPGTPVPGPSSGVDTGGSRGFAGAGPSSRGGGHVGGNSAAFWSSYKTFGYIPSTIGSLAHICSRYGGRPNLSRSRFCRWISDLTWTKVAYLWPDPQDTSPAPDHFAMPRWSTVDPNGPPSDAHRYTESAWAILNLKSRYAVNDGMFMTPGSWWFNDIARNQTWHQQQGFSQFEIHRLRGWMPDPQGAAVVVPLSSRARLCWFPYTLLYDDEIGIPLMVDEDGQQIRQTAYFVQILVYQGINENPIPARPGRPATDRSRFLGLGDNPIPPGTFNLDAMRTAHARDAAITAALQDPQLVLGILNPFAGLDPQSADAPAPVDFDHGAIRQGVNTDDTEAVDLRARLAQFRQDQLTFLGVARRGGRALLWSWTRLPWLRFDRGKADAHIWSIAAAQVFNDHSFDLWTQMWQSSLTDVGNYDRWLASLQTQAYAAGADDNPSAADLTEVTEYLTRARTLALISQGP